MTKSLQCPAGPSLSAHNKQIKCALWLHILRVTFRWSTCISSFHPHLICSDLTPPTPLPCWPPGYSLDMPGTLFPEGLWTPSSSPRQLDSHSSPPLNPCSRVTLRWHLSPTPKDTHTCSDSQHSPGIPPPLLRFITLYSTHPFEHFV